MNQPLKFVKGVLKPSVFFFLVVCITLVPAWIEKANADPTDQAVREHEQRIKDDQLRRNDELQRNLPASDIFLQDSLSEMPSFEQEADQCFDIHTIDVVGVDYFDQAVIDEITEKFVDRCLGMASFQKIIRQISNLYLDKGFVTSKAYVQPQGVRDGVLEILVVEGKLESVEAENGELTERQLRWAFPVEYEQLLSLRDLEQGLENLNRLRQNQTKMDLLPGKERGTTVVSVTNQSRRAVSGGAGLNNSGSDATGEHLANVFVSWDNPTRSNDNLYLTVSESVDAPEGGQSTSYALAYSLPIGYAMLKLNLNQFDYQQKVSGAVVDFTTSGTSQGQTIGLDYRLHRGQSDKLTLVASLNRKESRNYLEDVFLDTSSRVLYLTDLGLKYTKYTDSGVLRINGSWIRSGDWLDAKTKVVSAENDFQFDKFSLDTTYSMEFSLADTPFHYDSSLSLFYTPDEVIASEALSLGGQYTVRGIEGSGIVGYSGGYWRNEISHSFEVLNGASLEFSMALDIGNSNTPEFPEHGREWMAGGVVSLSLASRWVGFDLTYAESLQSPEYLDVQDHGFYASTQVYF